MITAFTDKKFIIASDASAFELKEAVKKHFIAKNYEVKDVGTQQKDTPVAYYIAGSSAAQEVSDGRFQFGIILCGSGMGVCMAASKYKNVQCAACESVQTAKSARFINNANMLAFGANVVSEMVAIEMVETFIATEFLQGIENVADQEFLTDALTQLEGIYKAAAGAFIE